MPRGTTLAGQLAAMGFADTARAQRLITEDLVLDTAAADSGLLPALASAADPDLALASLAKLAGDADLRAALRADAGFRTRLIAVLGASAALGGHLRGHPGRWRGLQGPEALRRPTAGELRDEMLAATGARAGPHPVAALRVAYRRRLLRLTARDLTGAEDLAATAAALADLAAAALEAALEISRSQLPPGAAPCRLAGIAA